MDKPFVPWSQALLDALEDGGWHSRDEIMSLARKAVPPHLAFRRGETLRNRPIQRPNGPGPRTGGTDESDSIRLGANAMVRSVLDGHVRGGRIRRKDSETGPVYKLVDDE